MVISKILDSFKVIKDHQDFPYEAMEQAVAQREEITPYLLDSLDYVYENSGALFDSDDPYSLHLYAMYLLAQFREKHAFPKLIRLLTLDYDVIDFLVGDAITEDYPQFLISTYDGNVQSVFDIIENEELNAFVRLCPLSVCEWLYQQGEFSREEFTQYLHRLATEYANDEDGVIGGEIAKIVSDNHLIELMGDVRDLYDNKRADPMYIGDYDSFLDDLFDYRQKKDDRLKPVENAVERFDGWVCFGRDKSAVTKKNYQSIKRTMEKYEQRENREKIGRNDPCPCGSGKKYKKCCMEKDEKNQQAEAEDSKRARQLLKEYPLLSDVPEGQLPFTDYFDFRSIEVDIPVYKALHHRASLTWAERDDLKEQKENIAYLTEGYRQFLALCEDEKLSTFQQYDEKHRVHYAAKDWMGQFATALDEFFEAYPLNEAYKSLREEVGQTIQAMS